MIEPPDRTTAPVPSVERRTTVDGVELTLNVDPVALQALEAARAAGGSPADYGALPSLDELPLRVVTIEYRLERIEDVLGLRL